METLYFYCYKMSAREALVWNRLFLDDERLPYFRKFKRDLSTVLGLRDLLLLLLIIFISIKFDALGLVTDQAS